MAARYGGQWHIVADRHFVLELELQRPRMGTPSVAYDTTGLLPARHVGLANYMQLAAIWRGHNTDK